MTINELIEQIGGREKIEAIATYSVKYDLSTPAKDVALMTLALLAVLDAKPIIYEAEINGVMSSVTKSHYDECKRFGVPTRELYTTPPAASVPDASVENYRDAMQGIGHIRRTLEETFGGLHGTHFEPDVLRECKQICDAIYSAYRAPAPGGE